MYMYGKHKKGQELDFLKILLWLLSIFTQENLSFLGGMYQN